MKKLLIILVIPFFSCGKSTCRCETEVCVDGDCSTLIIETEINDEAECPETTWTDDSYGIQSTTTCKAI